MRTRKGSLTRSCLLLACAAALVSVACDEKSQSPPKAESNEKVAERPQAESRPGSEITEQSRPKAQAAAKTALLLAQAQFAERETDRDTTHVVPGPAKLTFVYPERDRWIAEVLEDPDGNVFHKAMPFDLPGEQPGILTISANTVPLPAMLKVWRRTADGWKDTVLWAAEIGHRFNRLRDVEIADVTGDQRPDIVIGTHDQGIVAVLQKEGDVWQPMEIDGGATTIFVHEIEIGDVDGDGVNEIFATPSARNRADGGPQPGSVVMYHYNGHTFSSSVVDDFGDRHAREILVARAEGTGPPDLFAVVEIVMRQPGNRGNDQTRKDLEIRQYRFTKAGPVGSVIATLPDIKCRFLNAGDVNGDGKTELIASGFKCGIWIIKPTAHGWVTQLIDADASGYQNASTLADMDGDGSLEIYVAADDQQKLRRYRWTGGQFERTDLFTLTKGDITWCLTPCLNARCLAVQ
jgi:hypothetical protein